MPPRNGVFISYARTDGEEFANHLRQRLETENIPLWQDRVRMQGGRDWWLQITEALNRVEFMVLVITPNALTSDTVRKEWRYARQQGVCVYPIKGTPNLDFNSLPRWMRDAHFYDLDHEWQKFVNDLNTRCQQKRVPFMVEDLPEGFVPRPGEFDQLLKLLINERREEPVAITAALRGAGGYGKTTLAKALCHNERIQEAFDDGILWVTLGENPGDLTGRIEDLIVTLGDERPGFATEDAAVSRLKELLVDRDILMVIDDVWDRAHLNPFIQGGPRCARLITTRNFDTLPAGADRVHVDAMQQDEATALLAAGLDHNGIQGDLKNLASRLGEWPLLLRLVNSALLNRIKNDKQSPRDAVTWINKAFNKRGLTYFDAHNSEARNQAVVRTIGVSLDLLNAQDRERYGELAIFPEDVEIPVSTVEKLWARTGRFDEFDTEGLCTRLNRFSLLWSYDANRKRIRLHDVIRKFLIDQQRDKLPAIHRQLLDSHRLSSSSWSEMSAEEPYLWDHLAYHLVQAERGDELVLTVKDWRYLVEKTLLRSSLAVEGDLLAAEKIESNDEALRLLRRNFVNSNHLLNLCENRVDVKTTLFSRLQHLADLTWLTHDLEEHLERPYLAPANMMPDLPPPALVRTLTGHTEWIRDCAISRDGSMIVSASEDHTVIVWDAQTGAKRFILLGHGYDVTACAISADGSIIVSASADKCLKVWDGRTGSERLKLTGHTDSVEGCAVSMDGALIVSASADKTLKVWDGRSGVERFTLRGHKDAVHGCALSEDGTMIVSASTDRTLKVWEAQTGIERFTLTGHEHVVNRCAVSSDGATIVSASADHTVKVWDAHTGIERFTLTGQQEWVSDCAISADGGTIVSVSNDKIFVWDGHSGTERFQLSGHAGWVNGCAVSADGSMIISASEDETVKVWDGRSVPEVFIVSDHAFDATICAVSADGNTIVAASDTALKVWEKSGTIRFILEGTSGPVNSCAVNADGRTIVSTANGTLNVWDGACGVERFKLQAHKHSVSNSSISADGLIIITTSGDQTVKIWNGQNGTERFTHSGFGSGWIDCALSADGTTVVEISDQKIRVWDVQSRAERFARSSADDWFNDCALSADGTTIVTANEYEKVVVWDGRHGSERHILSHPMGRVTGCAVAADGLTILSVCEDGAIKIWDGHTGECLSILTVDSKLYGCACSADGEVIAATGPRGIYFLRLVR